MDDLNFLQSSFSEIEKDKSQVPYLSRCPKIIVVEDDKILGISIKKYLSKKLETEIFHFTSASDCLETLSSSSTEEPFCIITDISLEQGSDGLLLLDILREKKYQFVSIAMTGFASIETAIAATKKGVFHYLTKPFELDVLHRLILDALEKKLGFKNELISANVEASSKPENKNLAINKLRLEPPKDEDIFCGMIGRSKLMKEVFERIEKVSLSDSTILITGASVTGKEFVSNVFHEI